MYTLKEMGRLFVLQEFLHKVPESLDTTEKFNAIAYKHFERISEWKPLKDLQP